MIKGNQKLLNVLRFVIDISILVLSFYLSYILRFDEEYSVLIRLRIIDEPIGLYGTFKQYAQMLPLLIPCYVVSYYLFHLYDPKRVTSRRAQLINIFKANIVGILYCTAALYFIKSGNYARLFILIFVALNFSFEIFFRLAITTILRKFRKKGHNLKHVLLVGYGRTAKAYIDRIFSHPEWGYVVHGILDDSRQNGKSYRDIQVIGDVSDLEEILATNSYDEIAITLGIDNYNQLEGIVAITEKSGVHTKFIPDYNNVIPTKPYTEDLDGLPVIHVRNVPLTNSFNKFVKRAMDIVGSLCAIILFSIPMLVISIIIKATSDGPLIFKQERIGIHSKPFMMYKFRSMAVQQESEEKKGWTTKNDPRVTPIGKIIRKTSLDELPQFFNVLKGEMSLVGPRPERPQFVEKFKEEIPRYMVKHQVRPGITGWAQVNGYRGDTSIRLRVDCDLYYIENWSVMLDIKILLLTVVKGFVNENAY
ncbi:undecaprenyl-phosphate glucose phosphotransferase [Eubacterium xylanophilum]|uniref:undecaprenyl-phosphate glucose phosphotransferase n=1 Tax=Eubacterium xylanophilum TaxID=39497 RepID=UPI000479AB9F|nr:undecaprenyl-phosphate glucose phosphotransferase [Eubacterium xylanophilum]